MELEDFIGRIESEWESENGFFWQIRQGQYHRVDFDRALSKIVAVPSPTENSIPLRLVSVLWYAPLFMQWQLDRVRESGGDVKEYTLAANKLSAEVERILGVP